MKIKYGILILVGISLTGFFVIGFDYGLPDKPTIVMDGFSFSDFYGNYHHLFLLIVPIVMFIIIWEYRKRSV